MLLEALVSYTVGKGLDRAMAEDAWHAQAADGIAAAAGVSLTRQERQGLADWLRDRDVLAALVGATPQTAGDVARRVTARLAFDLGARPENRLDVEEKAGLLAAVAVLDLWRHVADDGMVIALLASRRLQQQSSEMYERLGELVRTTAPPADDEGLAIRVNAHDRQELALLMTREHDHPWVATPLDVHVRRLLTEQPWHDRIRQYVDAFRHAGAGFEQMQPFVQLAERLRYDDGYDALLADLRVLTGLRLGSACSSLLAMRKEKGESDVELEARLAPARRCIAHARALIDQVNAPSLARVAFVFGSWGSGRTRLHISALGSALSRQDVCLMLRTPTLEPLEEAVLRRAQAALGRDITSLEDVNERLDDGDRGRCLVCIDDVHEWTVSHPHIAADLLDTIRATSRLHSIRWLVTADEGHLDLLVHRDMDTEAWEAYSRVPDDHIASEIEVARAMHGWIAQDEINRRKQLGVVILQRHGTTAGSATFDFLRADDSQFRQETETLSNPRHAWLANALGRPHLEPADLYLDVFVDRWWDERLADLDDAGGKDHRLLIDRLAGHFADAGGVLRDLDAIDLLIREPVSRHLHDYTEVRTAIDRLVRAGLLNEDPPSDSGQQAIRPHPPIVWGTLMARRVVDRATTDPADDAIGPWFERAAAGQPLAEAVGRAVLVAWDRRGTGRRHIEPIWRTWLAGEGLASTAAWLAAGDATGRMQELTMKLSEGSTSHHPRSTRQVFTLLYFVGHLSPAADIRLPRRLRLLQSSYPRIGELGLGGYLGYVLARQLADDQLTPRDLRATLLALSGTERAGCADLAAEAAMAATESAFAAHWDDIQYHVLRWLRQAASPEHAAHFPRTQGRSDHSPPFWDRYLQKYCFRHAEVAGMEAFHGWREAGWYRMEAELPPGQRKQFAPVARTMAKYANVGLGRWFRRHSRDPTSDEYVALVDDLSRQEDLVDQRIAYYLLRHSAVSEQGTATRVSKVFHPALARLRLAHEQRPIAGTLPTDAATNLDEEDHESE